MGFISIIPGDIAELLAKARLAKDMMLPMVTAGMEEVVVEGVNALSEAAPIGENHLEDIYHPPPGDAPGRLADSFRSGGVISTAQGAHGEVSTVQPLKFKFVTQGTPALIFPKYKRYMYWEGAPHPMAMVHGQEPNPFQEDALPNVMESGRRIFLESIYQAFVVMEG